jgi:hypothetical protein
MGFSVRIRQHQFATLEQSVLQRANARLVQYARERFPEEFREKPEEQLMGLVDQVRVRARRYGITSEQDVATALDLTIMYGPDFYAAEWASDVFAVDDWDGAYKLNIIRARMRRQVSDF